jgi:hypothetical protein
MRKIVCILGGVVLLAGCTTNIHDKNETVIAPKVPFGKFSRVVVKPIVNDASESEFPANAVTYVQTDLDRCLPPALGSATPNPAAPMAVAATLLVEPTITDGKKVSAAQRIFFGALAGSSAVLMQVKFTDTTTNELIAQPVFYAKAAAMSGAWTLGAQDNAMLGRIAADACSYVSQYR